jgi:hypothetical protein
MILRGQPGRIRRPDGGGIGGEARGGRIAGRDEAERGEQPGRLPRAGPALQGVVEAGAALPGLKGLHPVGDFRRSRRLLAEQQIVAQGEGDIRIRLGAGQLGFELGAQLVG